MRKILSSILIIMLSFMPFAESAAKGKKDKSAKLVLVTVERNMMHVTADGKPAEPSTHEEEVVVTKGSQVANLLVKKISKKAITFQVVDNMFHCEEMKSDSTVVLTPFSTLNLINRGITDVYMHVKVFWVE